MEAAGCRTVALDVDDAASTGRVVRQIEDAHGSVAALVNDAGFAQAGAVEAVPMERVRRQFETNVFGLVRLTQLVLPGMRARRAGRIVDISSMGGKLVFPGAGYYHATKYAASRRRARSTARSAPGTGCGAAWEAGQKTAAQNAQRSSSCAPRPRELVVGRAHVLGRLAVYPF